MEWETGKQPEVDPKRMNIPKDPAAPPPPALRKSTKPAGRKKRKPTKMKCLFPPGVPSVRCQRRDGAGHCGGDGVPSSPHVSLAHPSSRKGCPPPELRDTAAVLKAGGVSKAVREGDPSVAGLCRSRVSSDPLPCEVWISQDAPCWLPEVFSGGIHALPLPENAEHLAGLL